MSRLCCSLKSNENVEVQLGAKVSLCSGHVTHTSEPIHHSEIQHSTPTGFVSGRRLRSAFAIPIGRLSPSNPAAWTFGEKTYNVDLTSFISSLYIDFNNKFIVRHAFITYSGDVSDLLCGRSIGRITRFARPSVCPSVLCGLVTRKTQKNRKMAYTFPNSNIHSRYNLVLYP